MAKYIVKSPLKLDGKRYEPGKSVEIKDDRTEVIEPLLAAGVIQAASPGETAPAETAQAVISKIMAAQTTDEVVELSHADTRKTVLEAAKKRLGELGALE